jgi:hypothetical protein
MIKIKLKIETEDNKNLDALFINFEIKKIADRSAKKKLLFHFFYHKNLSKNLSKKTTKI